MFWDNIYLVVVSVHNCTIIEIGELVTFLISAEYSLRFPLGIATMALYGYK